MVESDEAYLKVYLDFALPWGLGWTRERGKLVADLCTSHIILLCLTCMKAGHRIWSALASDSTQSTFLLVESFAWPSDRRTPGSRLGFSPEMAKVGLGILGGEWLPEPYSVREMGLGARFWCHAEEEWT